MALSTELRVTREALQAERRHRAEAEQRRHQAETELEVTDIQYACGDIHIYIVCS